MKRFGMKILSPTEISELEFQTMNRQNVSSRELMERAARVIFQKIQQWVGECSCHFTIFCGPGNNGGDGLTLAWMLQSTGHTIDVFLVDHDRYSEENQYRQNILKNNGTCIDQLKLDEKINIRNGSIIIDALFGQGLKRPLNENWSNFIQQINNLSNSIISIDVPSGLSAHHSNNLKGLTVHATHTFCISFPTLNVLLPENAKSSGNISIVDIGLDKLAWETFETTFYYTCRENVTMIPQVLNKFSHKGTFGHALVVGGSYGSIGAMTLSCRAAQRTGCGIVTTYVPKCGYDILQSTCPEALVQTDNSMNVIHHFKFNPNDYDAIGLGMGLGQQANQTDAFFNFMSSLDRENLRPKFLFDADAINILAKLPELHDLLPPLSILTPHPKELKRLIGDWSNDLEKLKIASNWCTKYRQIMVIKGAHTAVLLPDGNIHFNSTGNPGMATAGSGDVLSGIITSLLAQRYPSAEAAILGVFIHGLAGDLAAIQSHPRSLIASDISEHISEAWKQIAPHQQNMF